MVSKTFKGAHLIPRISLGLLLGKLDLSPAKALKVWQPRMSSNLDVGLFAPFHSLHRNGWIPPRSQREQNTAPVPQSPSMDSA
jgi:hypothetical protein